MFLDTIDIFEERSLQFRVSLIDDQSSRSALWSVQVNWRAIRRSRGKSQFFTRNVDARHNARESRLFIFSLHFGKVGSKTKRRWIIVTFLIQPPLKPTIVHIRRITVIRLSSPSRKRLPSLFVLCRSERADKTLIY